MPKNSAPATQPSSFRAPIVAILGHVDHGKTTLLDYIRKTHVQAKEVGGITQGIGAYQAEFKHKPITFIDTPGHAAFSKMRSRGASVADLAVLVVAADDGVKPQTEESVKHLKQAGIPFVVAVSKMDKPGVTADTAKAELTKLEVFVEGYGGNTPTVALSGKTGDGVDDLLENILLLAELEELKADPSAPLQAPVIEARKDSQKGIVVSVVVKAGTLRVGSEISTPTAPGKVRALFSDSGESLPAASPGQPTQILGFKSLPEVGETVTSGSTTPTSPASSVPADPSDHADTTDLPAEQAGSLNVILKSDSLGSLEAIKGSLAPEINLISEGTGPVTDADILLAASTGSLVLGFAVPVSSKTRKLGEIEGVTIKTYPVIYELLEYLEKKVLRLMEPTIDKDELGIAKILQLFEINKDLIAGCKVESGRLAVGDTVHLKKKDGELKNARIKSLRVGKDEVKEVSEGKECGVLLFPKLDIDLKSLIIAYKKTKTDED